jgi:SAM-dependent methyltransferase
MATSPDPKERFSTRVLHYARSRPSYPPVFYRFLETVLALPASATIADIGSGTGISARPLLESGHTVIGVEPNTPMRRAAEQLLARFPNFRSVDAAAESTTLPDASVDLVLAAQAFHWFDRPKSRAEFARILKPAGQVVLVWNERKLDNSDFLRGYEALLQKYATDYTDVRHENVDAAAIGAFFAPAPFQTRTFANAQHFDHSGLESRLLSSSYTPTPDRATFIPMLADLRRLFAEHQQGGLVSFVYDTRAHFGRLA